MTERKALVVDVDRDTQEELLRFLQARGYQCVNVASADRALEALWEASFCFTLVDLSGNGTAPTALIHDLKLHGPKAGPIIAVADCRDRSLTATSLGVDTVLQKPLSLDELQQAIDALVRPQLGAVAPAAPDHTVGRIGHEMALWRSPRMAEVQDIIERAAQADVTVLITGDTGTGKDLVARAIHHLSFRQHRPYIKVNCAAVPRDLLESELFGHERGAFTGAHQLKLGKFEAANHGTIFLDEIGDLHPALQGKLLHALQDGEFSRVGGKSAIKVDVRVLAATNQDLERAVAAGRFREDLYYRLNVIQIAVPPLRERREEIPLLAEYFIQRYSKAFRREGFAIPPLAMERLLHHSYPGNVRELENLVKRMIVLSDPHLTRTFVTPSGAQDPKKSPQGVADLAAISLKDIARNASQAAEREAITMMLDRTGWNRTKAANLLGISYRALLYKIKQAGLKSHRRATDRVAGGTP